MSNSSITIDKYHTLDALRGVAALVVVQMHAKWWFDGSYLKSGYLAVDFFFLLSGFVIAHAYGEKLKSRITFQEFMAIRLIRLYPLYFLALILTFVLLFIRGDKLTHLQILFSISFLPDFTSVKKYWIVAASWSLAFELFINIIFALFYRQITNSVLIVTCGIGLVLLTYSTMTFGSLDVGYAGNHIIGGFGRILFSFPLGVLIYRLSYRVNIKNATILSFLLIMIVLSINASKDLKPWTDLAGVAVAMPIDLSPANSSRFW